MLAFLAQIVARLPLKKISEPLTLLSHINGIVASCGEPLLTSMDPITSVDHDEVCQLLLTPAGASYLDKLALKLDPCSDWPDAMSAVCRLLALVIGCDGLKHPSVCRRPRHRGEHGSCRPAQRSACCSCSSSTLWLPTA